MKKIITQLIVLTLFSTVSYARTCEKNTYCPTPEDLKHLMTIDKCLDLKELMDKPENELKKIIDKNHPLTTKYKNNAEMCGINGTYYFFKDNTMIKIKDFDKYSIYQISEEKRIKETDIVIDELMITEEMKKIMETN